MESKLMQCPFCAHQRQTTSIGAVFCGPHKLVDGSYSPACQMAEVKTGDDFSNPSQ